MTGLQFRFCITEKGDFIQANRSKFPLFLFTCAALCIMLVQPASASDRALVYYVHEGMAGDCLSWESACDLQTALGMAVSGYTIYVGAGTYYPTTTADRSISFQMKNGLTLLSGFPAAGVEFATRNRVTNPTTLSANIGDPALETDNSYHVVKNEGVDSTAVLEGFVITGWYGVGILNISSSPNFFRLLIIDNEVTNGAGGRMYSYQSSPTLNHVTFTANHANSGVGMNNEEGTITVTNSAFEDNKSHFQGGGLANYTSSPDLTNITFVGNSAPNGGNIQFREQSPQTVQHHILQLHSDEWGCHL